MEKETASWLVNPDQDYTSEPLNDAALQANAEWEKESNMATVTEIEPKINIDPAEKLTASKAEALGVKFNPDFKPDEPASLEKAA